MSVLKTTGNRTASSLNRYGHITLIAGNRASIEDAFEKYEKAIKERVLND